MPPRRARPAVRSLWPSTRVARSRPPLAQPSSTASTRGCSTPRARPCLPRSSSPRCCPAARAAGTRSATYRGIARTASWHRPPTDQRRGSTADHQKPKHRRRETTMTTITHPGQGGAVPRVVVAGAGFGGLAAVRPLARAGARTTLIDRNVYATFQPLLYQLATGGLAGSDVAYPLRAAARRYGAVFRHGELAGVDPAARQVRLADGAALGYDYLILATGVAAAHHGIPGAAEHSLGLYTRHDAIVLRDRIMMELDRIGRTGLRDDVTVTVIGGGATGVELAGSLADLRNIALAAYFPEIDPARVHIALVQHGPALLAAFHPVLRGYTLRQLAGRGVEIRLGTAIAEVTPGKVVLADGSALHSD